MAHPKSSKTAPSKLQVHIDALETQGVGVTLTLLPGICIMGWIRPCHRRTCTVPMSTIGRFPPKALPIAEPGLWAVVLPACLPPFSDPRRSYARGQYHLSGRARHRGWLLDGAGNAEDGYIVRGGREMEMTYQNFWDVFSEIPALEMPKPFTVLDEYRIVNDADKNWSKARLLEKQGQIKDFSTMELSKRQQLELVRLLLARKEDLDDITVEEWFSEGFLTTNFYTFWRTMFAFQNWHSVLEMKLYMHRFLHLMDGLNDMTSLVFPKYNQYDGFVRPLMSWLKDQGVNIQYDTVVENLEMTTSGDTRTVAAIQCHGSEGDKTFNVGDRDLVFVTTGSMTEDTAYGDDNTAPQLKESDQAGSGSGWQLWKTWRNNPRCLAGPKFCDNIPGSTWESVTLTCKPSPLVDKLKELSVNDPYSGFTATGGIITFTDSSWLMSFTCNRQPHFPDQPDDVLVLWTYALLMDKPGDYVKKPCPNAPAEKC